MSTACLCIFYDVMIKMDSCFIIAVVALLFLIVMVRFAGLLRGVRRVNSACPPGKQCDTPHSEPTAPAVPAAPTNVTPDGVAAEVVPEVVSCPQGACAFTDSVYTSGSECGPSCVCTRCRQSVRGGAQGVRPCKTLLELDDALRSADVVVLFWAQGCGPCAMFKPTYQSAALKARVPFYAVEYSDVPEVVDRFQLKGFPTVYRFRSGALYAEYGGNRTEADLLAWATA